LERYRVKVNGKVFEVEIEPLDAEKEPQRKEKAVAIDAVPQRIPSEVTSKKDNKIKAPMPGKILKVAVEAGQEVSSGAILFVMEAMKMECEITAPRDGRIEDVKVSEGSSVQAGDILAVYA